ncbi:hypothetical protein Ssi03_15670 [Sphaerisporangium siamense]|uniref:Uncharacterized protein n=1 Tax=Sphaerisporangium siamense TaxID=795645 RepID=A0A7W7GBQ1_9ACTN|nr:hypothetical protein [Sphaerisporangium siamense]MBB4702669.1 hypothetical protein [Sphaerisporangium siamense]GII83577.1 hypothetical protein Ssi03_15670 [Sphaerisporangium siamense]
MLSRSGLAWNTTRLVAIVVSVALVLTGIAAPTQAGVQALSACEGAKRAGAQLAASKGGTIRLMCAADAPASLAALAADDDDLVATIKVEGDRAYLQAEGDMAHKAQAAGKPLGDYLISYLKTYEVGVYPIEWELSGSTAPSS